MEGFSEERAYLIAAADELEDYLLSGAANWRIAGRDSFPPLTPGNLLLTMKQLVGLSTADKEFEQIQRALDTINEVRLHWNSAWKKRIKQEIPQRLRLWANFMDGFYQTSHLDHEFRWSVRWRVILALLANEINEQDQATGQQLSLLDEDLRAVSRPGPFVWDQRLERVFDRAEFWFLYLNISPLS